MNGAAAFLNRRWPALALAASLVLNGFLIGMFAADYARPHWGRGHGPPRVFGFELRRMESRLSREALKRVRADLAPQEPAMQDRFERLRAARDEINRMAAAPEPDRPAIDARLTQLRSDVASMQEAVQKAIFDAVLKLPPNLRAGLAEAPDKGWLRAAGKRDRAQRGTGD